MTDTAFETNETAKPYALDFANDVMNDAARKIAAQLIVIGVFAGARYAIKKYTKRRDRNNVIVTTEVIELVK